MEENGNKLSERLTLGEIIDGVWQHKRLFFITMPVAAILAYLLILGAPRYYVTDTRMVPEMEGMGDLGGGLSGLAQSFGIDLGGGQTSDAISPLLYPDLMDDNGFVADLFTVQLNVWDEEKGAKVQMSYYDYMAHHQETAWWTLAWRAVKRTLLPPPPDIVTGEGGEFNPYILSNKDMGIVKAVQDQIQITIDKKTGVISISVEDQDQFVCKAMADSVRTRLQSFITKYRTSKATIDMEYYEGLMNNAKAEYDDAMQRFVNSKEGNINAFRQSVKSHQDELEIDMQMKLQTYQTLATQYEAAKAKVQERTPAFTLIKGANVPIKPAGPKRMIFSLFIAFLVAVGDLVYIFRKDIFPDIKTRKEA